MRTTLLVALLVGCAPAASPEPRYLTVGADLAASARLSVEERAGDVAVVEVDGNTDLDALAQIAHEQHGRCGGFMVHDSLADARAALVARPERAFEYTVDRDLAVRAVLPTLDETQLLGTIRALSAMPTRHYRSETGVAAAAWLQARWQALAAGRPEITVDRFEHGWPQDSVIMRIPGTTKADEVVVIGGHLDSITFRGTAAPGADDDASGIATVTEIARALLAANYRPERTIHLMAYAAEEVGLRGSQEIARDYGKRGVNVVGALQLDMTNYRGSDKDIWLMKDFTSAAQNAFLVKLIETYVGATYGMDACGYACSDHASWHKAGVPASMPFEARSREYNAKIHTKDDTLERSGGNASHAIKFARLGAAYAIEMGKGELAGEAMTATTTKPQESHRRPWLAIMLGVVGVLWVVRVLNRR